MFQQLSEAGRQVLVFGGEEVGRLRHPFLGAGHLLLGVLRLADDPAASELRRLKVDLPGVRVAVADAVAAGALRTVGIDLESVRERVDTTFGAGALSGPPRESRRDRKAARATSGAGRTAFAPEARTALEAASRAAARSGHDRVEPGHIVLGLLCDGEGMAAAVLRGQGVAPEDVRAVIENALR